MPPGDASSSRKIDLASREHSPRRISGCGGAASPSGRCSGEVRARAQTDAIPQPDLDRVRCRGGCANRLTTGPWHKGLYNPVSGKACARIHQATGIVAEQRQPRECSPSVQICEICGRNSGSTRAPHTLPHFYLRKTNFAVGYTLCLARLNALFDIRRPNRLAEALTRGRSFSLYSRVGDVAGKS
jgi:hypothetical protein